MEFSTSARKQNRVGPPTFKKNGLGQGKRVYEREKLEHRSPPPQGQTMGTNWVERAPQSRHPPAKQPTHQLGDFSGPGQMTAQADQEVGSGSPLSIVGSRWTEPGPKSVTPDYVPSYPPGTVSLLHESKGKEATSPHTQEPHRSAEEEVVWEGPGDWSSQA